MSPAYSTEFRTLTFTTPNGMRLTTEVAVYHHDEAMPGIGWREVAMSDCPFGCKVYQQPDNPLHFSLGHNSNYGCKR